jgi:hypothetical protein
VLLLRYPRPVHSRLFWYLWFRLPRYGRGSATPITIDFGAIYRLIKRSGPPCSFKATLSKTLDEAVWAAREDNEDYLIEETPDGVAPGSKVVKYRLGKFEMG